MDKNREKQIKSKRRHARVRAKISGTARRPRLSVFKSNKGMYIQVIDDEKGKTLISASSKDIKKIKASKDEKMSPGMKISYELGKLIAKKALDKKISKVVFDKGSSKYHGRVKAVADGAREGGLQF